MPGGCQQYWRELPRCTVPGPVPPRFHTDDIGRSTWCIKVSFDAQATKLPAAVEITIHLQQHLPGTYLQRNPDMSRYVLFHLAIFLPWLAATAAAAVTDANHQTAVSPREQLLQLQQHRQLKQLQPAEIFAVNHEAIIESNARPFTGTAGAGPSTAKPTAAPGDIVAVGLDSTKSGVSLLLLDGKTLTPKAFLNQYLSGVCSAINTATLAVNPRTPTLLMVACQRVPPPASPTNTRGWTSTSTSSSPYTGSLSSSSDNTSSASSSGSTDSSNSYQLVLFDVDSQTALPIATFPAGYEPGSATFDSDGSLYIQATKVLSAQQRTAGSNAAAAGPSNDSAGISGKADASSTAHPFSLSVMFKFDTDFKLVAQYDLPLTQGAVAALDITANGKSTLLYTHFSPTVGTFYLKNQTAGESLDFKAIPGLASSSCTSVAALYDGTTLVGCTSSLTDPVLKFCAYLINRTSSGAEVVRGPFCAPALPPTKPSAAAATGSGLPIPLNPGWVNIAVDADRQHFYMSVIDGVSAGGGDVGVNMPNLYKVGLSDFKQVQSAFVLGANMVSMVVVGAAPASQVRVSVDAESECAIPAFASGPPGTSIECSAVKCSKSAFGAWFQAQHLHPHHGSRCCPTKPYSVQCGIVQQQGRGDSCSGSSLPSLWMQGSCSSSSACM